ncbi:uncharacterized protein LOC143749050 isoform X2 [Siphateles boraxobius]|uniref:uncharacterized protein LOC143749050 isoform X2 n=1 Tax=Siphateles boraxobius TaxID=180520 RepID=UPI004062979B
MNHWHEPHFDKQYLPVLVSVEQFSTHTRASFSETVWSTMRFKTVVVILCFLVGVFGAETDNTETVSVMVGDSVTLHTDIGEIKRNDDIVWRFGPDSSETLIAEIIKWSYMFYIYVSQQVPFRDRLQLDYQTGSLTIKKTRSEHSGVYKLTIVKGRKTSIRSFTVKVYAPLPIPMISSAFHNSTASERSSGPACVLMCSVKNATQATLSLYRGNDLVSSVSGSDLSNTLSIPLEMEYFDENTYSCVVNNPLSNQTTLLNVSDLCQPPSGNVGKQNKRLMKLAEENCEEEMQNLWKDVMERLYYCTH